MTTPSTLTQQLIEAQRTGIQSVDQSLLSGINRTDAYVVQRETMVGLGAEAGMYKVAVAPGGAGIIAPIYAERVAASGSLTLPAGAVAGLEVEIGMVLANDLPPGSDRSAVEAAIGRYFVGLEICGTRYLERTAATADAALADNMSAFGYAIDEANWERGADIDGGEVVLALGGKEVYRAPAKHGFGGVLEALVAYAGMTEQPYPLIAGTILTTGSMCGLVPVSGIGTAVAEFGGRKVTCELV